MDKRNLAVIEQLYLEMYDMLFTYARCSLNNDSLAEEAVQETFHIACQKPDALCSSKNPKGWLVKTLKNVLSNMHRSRATATRILNSYVAVRMNEVASSRDRVKIEILYEDIAKSEEFLLLKEMAIDGSSQLEMAKARGISVAACKKRVQRAKEALRKKLKSDVTK